MDSKDLTVISMSFRSHILWYVVQFTRQISAGKLRWETARWQTGCCRQTQHNTAAVSLSDCWAWYCCNPVKAFWRITMSNGKPCNMHHNNKGILHTSFNLQSSRSLPRFPPLLLLFLYPYTTYLLFFPLHLSITVHVTPFDVYAPIHHPFILFYSISSLQSLFVSGCLLTPPSCQSVSAGFTFFASYLMPQWCN